MRRLFAVALLALACCGRAAPPARQKILHASMTATPPSLSMIAGNPDRNADIVASLLTDSLVRYDASLTIRPNLARSWETSPDGLTWTFHLREDAKWHDGVPVTASDVVWTVRKVRDPATQALSYFSQFQDLVTIDAPDPATVRAVYKVPYADALDAWTLPILPEHVAGKDQDLLHGEFSRHPIGCGAFRFDHLEPGKEIALSANEEYRDGPPAIDGIVFRVLPDERTAFQALIKEDLDIMTVTPDLWKESTTTPRAHPLARYTAFPLAAWYIGWNQDASNPFFVDPRVRRALVQALDRPTFISRVLLGFARSAVSTWHLDSPWHDPALEPWPFDTQAAGALLDEAGWRDHDGDGIRDRDGVPFSFELMFAAGPQEITDRCAAWIQQSLRTIGVEVRLSKLEWNAFRERRGAHRFQALMASLIFAPIPDQFELYHSSARENGINFYGFHDEEVDALLVQGRTTFDPAARREIYHRLERRIHELEPISPLFHFAQPVLRDARLVGIEACPRSVYTITPGPRSWRFLASASGD